MALSVFSTPPNIATNYSGWQSWMNSRIDEIFTNCPTARGTTLYFSESEGDDSNDGLSEDTPKRTLSVLFGILNESEGDIRVRMKCGDMWRDSTDGTITTDNVTIDSYDSGEKPFINAFTIQYLEASNLWTQQGVTNRYTLTEANDIAFVRLQSDRLGLTTHIARLASSATCEATSNSFYYDPTADVLHINLGGVDPNTVDLEAVISNDKHGIAFSGDGCRVEGIRADGHGADRASAVTQKQPFTNLSNNDETNLFINCDGYWSSTHAMAHHGGGGSGSGGRSLWIGCKGGYASAAVGSASACSIFNSFSSGGGQETWFIDCEAQYGSVRNANWSYTTDKVEGVGFLWHTSGSDIGLVVVNNCVCNSDGPTQCRVMTDPGNSPTFTQDSFSDCRSFEVNSTYEEPPTAAAVGNSIGYGANIVRYGCRYRWRPLGGANRVMSVSVISNVYFLNCEFGWNMTDFGSSNLWMTQSLTECDVHYFHCFLKLSSWATTNGTTRFRVIGGTGTSLSESAPGTYGDTSRFVNNILSINGSVSTARFLGFNNIDNAAMFSSNAYWNVANAAANDLTHGKDNDANPQTLASEPAFGTSYDPLLENGATVLVLSNDINRKRRTVSSPDIGPVDFSSPVSSVKPSASLCISGLSVSI